MNDDKTSDTDDSEILAKFRSLLSKYQNQGNIIASPNMSATSAPTLLPVDDTAPAVANKIPVLTEAVILHPAVIQPQPKRLTPIRQILDAALADAHIEMDVLDRKVLANALEARLANQIK